MALLETWMRDRFKVSEQRLNHCRKCEHFEKYSSRCGVCGCFMNFKALVPGADCPIGKWKKVIIEDDPEQNQQT